jgi:hypothetical protein
MEFIDFIFVNCCLINIKSVKILKKHFGGGNFQMYSYQSKSTTQPI